MQIKTTADFELNDIAELFHSVDWDYNIKHETLLTAMKNSSHIATAWENGRLVGLIRSMDDGVWSATIDCLIVHKDYQRRGIASRLIGELLLLLKGIHYISVSPSDKANNSLYFKHGFTIVDGSSMLQISDE